MNEYYPEQFLFAARPPIRTGLLIGRISGTVGIRIPATSIPNLSTLLSFPFFQYIQLKLLQKKLSPKYLHWRKSEFHTNLNNCFMLWPLPKSYNLVDVILKWFIIME